MQRVRERVKAITAPRHRLPEPIEPIVAEVNRVVRGWGAYFRVGNAARKFHDVWEQLLPVTGVIPLSPAQTWTAYPGAWGEREFADIIVNGTTVASGQPAFSFARAAGILSRATVYFVFSMAY